MPIHNRDPVYNAPSGSYTTLDNYTLTRNSLSRITTLSYSNLSDLALINISLPVSSDPLPQASAVPLLISAAV